MAQNGSPKVFSRNLLALSVRLSFGATLLAGSLGFVAPANAQVAGDGGLLERVQQTGEWLAVDNGGQAGLGNQLGDEGNRARGRGALGGASAADFSQLMFLIQQTIDPDAWEAGEATMQPYPGGVWMDAEGVLKNVRLSSDAIDWGRLKNRAELSAQQGGWKSESSQRTVSLKRLLAEIERRKESGEAVTREMRLLAGLYRIDYVWVDRENSDLWFVGPAGSVVDTPQGYSVHPATRLPALLLDDVIAVAATALVDRRAIGCSIDPTPEGLSEVQAGLQEAGLKSQIARNPQMAAEKLCDLLGRQELTVFGVSKRSSAAVGMLEADQHMKRMGLGLEDGVAGLKNYPELVKSGAAQPSGALMRWWFAPNYPKILVNSEKNGFAIPKESVQLLSEQQWMDAKGERRATGKVDAAADKFAKDFTTNYEAISREYPTYARLKNTFDMAVAFTLATEVSGAKDLKESLAGFRELAESGELDESPDFVDPIATTSAFRQQGKSMNLVIVSGGVLLDPSDLRLAKRVQEDRYGSVPKEGEVDLPSAASDRTWWWDAQK